jgi:ABC-type Fe3+ transport system substrate-binding protein
MVMHGNYMAIPKDAPNPDAAKLFYDFLLRPQGQTELVRGEVVYSFMENFTPPPEVKPLILPIAALKRLSVQWENVTNDLLKEVHQEWKDIFLH